jgi:hypothetical protein
MKKVAFTLGLAFFAIGLFAQSGTTGGSAAKTTPTTTNTTVSRKEPLKANSLQNAQVKNQTTASAPTHSAGTAKAMPATKPASNNSSVKPAAKQTASAPTKAAPKKKHHHKKAKTTATGTEKSATPAPKKH